MWGLMHNITYELILHRPPAYFPEMYHDLVVSSVVSSPPWEASLHLVFASVNKNTSVCITGCVLTRMQDH